jgi:hypothetical protein
MFEVEFDFDESSKFWRKNKIYVGNGCFNYRCNHIYKNKKNCNKPIYSNTNFDTF